MKHTQTELALMAADAELSSPRRDAAQWACERIATLEARIASLRSELAEAHKQIAGVSRG